MEEVLVWHVWKWNQPMFTDHSTFIIGFCVLKIAQELAGMELFNREVRL
jgi:hypothetical protein